MAADLTFVAFPNTHANLWTLEVKAGLRLLPGDEEYWVDGEYLGIRAGDVRVAWTQHYYDDLDWFEVGPTQAEGGVAELQAYWLEPRVLTPGRIRHSMTLLNLPDGAYRRYWNRRQSGWKRNRWHVPCPGGRRGSMKRVARRQDVARWLRAHEGCLLLGEAW